MQSHMPSDVVIVIAARNEADRIGATLAALAAAFPGAGLWVADDCSTDATAQLARSAGATVVGCPRGTSRRDRAAGKGRAMTAAVGAAVGDALAHRDTGGSQRDAIVVLCDADLGESARWLPALAEAVRVDRADLAVGAFSIRDGGGFGVARSFARWAIGRRCGLSTRAPISGQRAARAGVLGELLPFAPGYGMEVGMTIDAVRAGHRVLEIDLPLSHRATRRTPAGFAHRARQMLDFIRVYRRR